MYHYVSITVCIIYQVYLFEERVTQQSFKK